MPERPDAWSKRFVCLLVETARRIWGVPPLTPDEKAAAIDTLVNITVTGVFGYNRAAFNHTMTSVQIRTLGDAVKAVLSGKI